MGAPGSRTVPVAFVFAVMAACAVLVFVVLRLVPPVSAVER